MTDLVECGFPTPIPESIAKLSPRLISQGAEAMLFVVNDGDEFVVKFRPRKMYRIDELDSGLRRRRTAAESRVLQRVKEYGVRTPNVLTKPVAGEGILCMELLKGMTLKEFTWKSPQEADHLFEQLGDMISKTHSHNIVHGDLTTSNVFVLEPELNSIALIDFGLAGMAASVEDKAVDLYVLERAVASTHPHDAERLNSLVMKAYTAANRTGTAQVLKRLAEVRLRGRKRSMLG